MFSLAEAGARTKASINIGRVAEKRTELSAVMRQQWRDWLFVTFSNNYLLSFMTTICGFAF